MSKPKAHIITATPTLTGAVDCEYAASLAVAASHCLMKGFFVDPRMAPGFSLVEYARNWLVAEFLSVKEATHLFWIDADLYFPPNAIYRLVARDLPVVAGVYTTKHPTAPVYPYTALGPPENGLQLAERVPGGFLCMQRAAVEKAIEDCDWHVIEHQGVSRNSPRFFALKMKDGKLVGEDYIACARLHAAGFPIYVETDIDFKHFGRFAWPANLAKDLASEAESGFVGQGTTAAWEKNKKVMES
jgi:hypothetical protein